ncbi:GNAT family N-acetyltransferase [Yinghuangia aomiensis]
MPELLPAFDLFVLGSRQEGLPVALMEAMATGLGVVVTRVGGMPEIVTDGVEGRVVPPGDPGALAAALAQAAADPRAAARGGRRRVCVRRRSTSRCAAADRRRLSRGARAMTEFTVREVAKDDEPEVLELLAAALAGGPTGERTQEFFDWKHRDNPFGSSPGLVAVDGDGRLAAVRLFLRWEFAHQGATRCWAVRAVDTATRPDVQGRGLFTKLTLGLLERLGEDTDLVFNTPNREQFAGISADGLAGGRQGADRAAPDPAAGVREGLAGAAVGGGRGRGAAAAAVAVPASSGARGAVSSSYASGGSSAASAAAGLSLGFSPRRAGTGTRRSAAGSPPRGSSSRTRRRATGWPS